MLRQIKKNMNNTKLCKRITKKVKEESIEKYLLEERTFKDGTKKASQYNVLIKGSDAL